MKIIEKGLMFTTKSHLDLFIIVILDGKNYFEIIIKDKNSRNIKHIDHNIFDQLSLNRSITTEELNQ